MTMIKKARYFLASLIFTVFLISLAACQADVVNTPPAPSASVSRVKPAETATLPQPPTAKMTSTPVPTVTLKPTATPMPGVFWVDPSTDLGMISPLVLGANHGPWSDLGLANIDPAKNAGITFLRWPGGNWGDTNDIQPIQIDNYMFEARMMGAVPSITVRLPNNTAEKAAALVRYVNFDKKYAVKYWSIGNEPNYYEQHVGMKTLGFNAVTYAQRWREFALAMKAADPSILLFGPDIDNRNDQNFEPMDPSGRSYFREFLKLNGDLVDIVTVHRYPFPVCQTCSAPEANDLFANTPTWDTILPRLREIVKETTGKDLPVGVTEYNSNYTAATSGDTTPDSFNNAIWLADVMGRLIRQRPEILAFWLLKDNNSGEGLMTSFDIHPTYYIFQIYKHFGNHLLPASSDEPMVSVFAAKKEDGSVSVVFVNRGQTPVKKALKLENGNSLKLAEVYLYDKDHPTLEALKTLPVFKNGNVVEVGPLSVLMYILRP